MGVSGPGVPDSDIREAGQTGYPGYLRDIRDIRDVRNQDQGWGPRAIMGASDLFSLISLIQHKHTPV